MQLFSLLGRISVFQTMAYNTVKCSKTTISKQNNICSSINVLELHYYDNKSISVVKDELQTHYNSVYYFNSFAMITQTGHENKRELHFPN